MELKTQNIYYGALNTLRDAAHRNAVDKGFHNDRDEITELLGGHIPLLTNYGRVAVASRLALIHSEVSEALELIRKDDNVKHDTYAKDGKPIGFSSELADIIIRVLDLSGLLGINIGKAVVEKLEYNASREYRHGKKL